METKDGSLRNPHAFAPRWRWVRDLVAIQTGVLILFSGLLYVFLNSELEANLASAHVRMRSTGAMLAPVLLTLTALTWVLSSLLLGGYAWLVGRRQAHTLATDGPNSGEVLHMRPIGESAPLGVEGSSRAHQESLPSDRAGLLDELKSLRQAHDAGDAQTVEACLRRMECLLERASD